MIRREIEITEEQSQSLRQLANRLGASEDELTRRALKAFLQQETARSNDHDDRAAAARELVRSTRELAKGRCLPDDFKRDYKEQGRSVLYDDRSRNA